MARKNTLAATPIKKRFSNPLRTYEIKTMNGDIMEVKANYFVIEHEYKFAQFFIIFENKEGIVTGAFFDVISITLKDNLIDEITECYLPIK